MSYSEVILMEIGDVRFKLSDLTILIKMNIFMENYQCQEFKSINADNIMRYGGLWPL